LKKDLYDAYNLASLYGYAVNMPSYINKSYIISTIDEIKNKYKIKEDEPIFSDKSPHQSLVKSRIDTIESKLSATNPLAHIKPHKIDRDLDQDVEDPLISSKTPNKQNERNLDKYVKKHGQQLDLHDKEIVEHTQQSDKEYQKLMKENEELELKQARDKYYAKLPKRGGSRVEGMNAQQIKQAIANYKAELKLRFKYSDTDIKQLGNSYHKIKKAVEDERKNY
jgi:hypothetical protein